MYYIYGCPECGQKIHVRIINGRNAVLRNNCGHLPGTTLSLRQIERLFKAKFRITTNDDGSKTGTLT